MPNIKQQEKRMRIAARERLENLRYKSSIKTLYKKLQAMVAEDDREGAAEVFPRLIALIDKAGARGVLHKNTVARKKSQVARTFARLSS